MMRKILPILSIAAAAALATPAFAEPEIVNTEYGPAYTAAPVVGGAAVGTVVGVGTYNAWWGTGAFASALPTTAAGAAAVGGVAGVGTVALIDAAIEPCRGFHALLGMNRDVCVNGVYVGDRPQRIVYRHGRRVIR